MARSFSGRRDRIKVRRTESLRPGRAEEIFPAGSSFGHTSPIPNESTGVRTLAKRIQVGDIFAGVVPRRHGAETAHFKIQAITPTRFWIKVRSRNDDRPVWAWVLKDDVESSIKTGLVRHVAKAPFEI